MAFRNIFIVLLLCALTTGVYCAEWKVEVKFKEMTPITTAYGYEIGLGTPGDVFEVQETRGTLAFGFYPMETGGIRGYVLLKNLEKTEELQKFMDAEKSRRNKLNVALGKKIELLQLPQPPGKTLTEYVEEKEKDFTTVNGVMLESTTWTKDKSPYLIIGPVYVPSGMILFIDPGVEIYCERSENPGARIASGQANGIIIAGNVLAIGRPDQAISFRGFRSKPTDRNTWGGITVLGSADPGSIFRWAIFENAATAVSCGRGAVISNCIFRYNYSAVLLDQASETATISNNIIMNNNTGLEVRGTPSRAEIFNNIIAFNEPGGGLRAWQGAEPLIAYNNMYRNSQDYIGWSPYSTDMRVNPMFADMENGDYHINERSRSSEGGEAAQISDFTAEEMQSIFPVKGLLLKNRRKKRSRRKRNLPNPKRAKKRLKQKKKQKKNPKTNRRLY